MQQRKRALLYLIHLLKTRKRAVNRTILDKMLFVLQQEYGLGELIKFYNFFPYDYGPFSNMFYLDLSDLESRGLMSEGFELMPDAVAEAEAAPEAVQRRISGLVDRFDSKDIVDYVYGRYPAYTVNSRLLAKVKRKESPGLYTIGYEGKDIDLFLDMLIQNRIETVIDVRANPFSMSFSFIGQRLRHYLEKVGINYLHIPELGIPGERRKNLSSEADYQKLFGFYRASILPNQMEMIRLLSDMANQGRIALLCFEADNNFCHRGVLSAELERIMGKKVTHL